MWSKSVNKTILILGLLALVLAVGVLTKTELGQGYFSWLRTALSGINLSTSESLKMRENALDFSNLNFDNIVSNQDKETEFISGILENEQRTKQIEQMLAETESEQSVVSEELTLEEAQEQIEEIGKRVDEISKEVGKMVVLNDIMSQLNQISMQAQKIGQEIGNPSHADILTDIQEQINTITEKANLLSQEIAGLA